MLNVSDIVFQAPIHLQMEFDIIKDLVFDIVFAINP